MDWLSFFASVIGSSAWPLAVIIIVFLLRKSLNRLLLKLTNLKYKDIIELNFDKETALAKIELKSKSIPLQLPEKISQKIQGQLYFQKLAETSPRAALLDAWLPFEIEASRIGRVIGVSNYDRPIQMTQLIEGLNRENVLNDQEAKAVVRLRNMRNNIVHTDSVDLSPESVGEYASLLQDITKTMEQRTKIDEAVLKKAIKEIVESEKVAGIPKELNGEINEEWLRKDLKRRISEKIEELCEIDKIKAGGIYDKIIDEIAEITEIFVKKIEISSQSGSIKTVLSNNDFDKLWKEIKDKSKLNTFLSN